MAGVNKVILIGNLGDEPSIRSTQTGTSVANASLCTSEKFKDQQGNTTEHNEWHRLVFWGRLADIVGQYCHKGSKLYVEGKIQSRQYDDKEGIKRTAFEIVVSEMQMLDSKNSGGNNNNSYGGNNNSYGNTNNNAYGNNGNRNSSNNNRSQNYYSQNNSYGQQNQQQNNAYGSNVNSNQQQQMPQRSYQPQMQQNQPVNNFNNAQGFSNTNNAPQQQEPLNDDLPF
ncbi:MAG: single-stranded DNA-binding protein [Succinivibrio dextrinosolvens]|nr:single-stranded DNA-binding protein [Succinivibrio dextrinosolvens]